MSRSARAALIGALAIVLTGAFLWKFGGTTGGVPRNSAQAEQIKLGWAAADQDLPPIAATLPALGDGSPGIPRTGTYLVNLWGSWCGPCKEEMPWLERFATSQSNIRVIGVTRDNIEANAVKIVRKRNLTYPNVRDEYGDFMSEVGGVVPAAALPSSLLVKDGVIVAVHIGAFTSYDDLATSVTARA